MDVTEKKLTIARRDRPIESRVEVSAHRLSAKSLERLCDLMAYTASRSSADGESRDISVGIPKTKKRAEKPDRWSKPGGPI